MGSLCNVRIVHLYKNDPGGDLTSPGRRRVFMNIARLAIRRPLFIICIVILIVVVGGISISRLGIDLLPPIDFPVVTVITTYPGANPEEIEKLISKPLEEQISTIAGIKRLSSRNMESASIVIAEFTYETDVRYAEEKMREKVALARNNLPEDLEDEPIVRQFDITEVPIMTFAVVSDLPPTKRYDLAKEVIKPMMEQVNGVGEVRLSGGTRRQILVELDRRKLDSYEMSAVGVANQLKSSGANIPIGKFDRDASSTLFRTIGEFTNLEQIKKAPLSFSGDIGGSVTVDKLAKVTDGAEDATTTAELYYSDSAQNKKPGFFNRVFRGEKQKKAVKTSRPCILIDVFKQSGENSVAVADGIMAKMPEINRVIKGTEGNPRLIFVYDTAKMIRSNIEDVRDTMIIGILLAVIVVYLFLGNVRSTIITGIAIPNSLLGAFVVMYIFGFTINLMSLLALSLTVGLLVDDAIVVRENIFRKLESGMHPFKAAERGTTEVALAVIATTLTIIAVFMPIGFLQGIIGRFFRQFGLTVVFAMLVSLFDALTMAPLLSAYFAGRGEKARNVVVRKFELFQEWLEAVYTRVMSYSLDHPVKILGITTLIFLGSAVVFVKIPKTFQPDPDEGEYLVNIQMPPETSLDGTHAVLKKMADSLVAKIPELDHMTIQAGNSVGQHNVGNLGVFMVHRSERKKTTNELKKNIRTILSGFAYAKPTVDNYTRVGGGGASKPYILNLKGNDLDQIYDYSLKVRDKLKGVKDLTEITSSYEAGRPEFQVVLDPNRMQMLGVANKVAGQELRYHVEGGIVGKFHESGLEYDVRLRMKEDQRNLKAAYAETRVPNMMMPPKLIPLTAISTPVDKTGPSMIIRQDRARAIQLYANISTGGAVGNAISRTKQILEKELPLPRGVTYSFIGQADMFQDMVVNIMIAFILSLIFIYLVLTSLYESFFTPVTILLALPPAMSGAFYALFVTGKMLDMFTMIGCVMLLGLVTKNSILLVDFALEGVRGGLTRKEAISRAGLIRLRPILMTTFAMLAGMLPVALGLGEAAKYRAGMGVAIIGGLILSTLITLIVVPAVFEYIDRFREFVEGSFRPEPDKEDDIPGSDDTTGEIAKDLENGPQHSKLFQHDEAGRPVDVVMEPEVKSTKPGSGRRKGRR